MTDNTALHDPLWDSYVLTMGEAVSAFWNDYLAAQDRDILFILGQGFDPRMCIGLETILGAGGAGKRDCLLVRYDEGEESASREHADAVAANASRLQTDIQATGGGRVVPLEITMWSDEGRRIGPIQIARQFSLPDRFGGYSDLVVDISALPRGMFFPILSNLLTVCLDGPLHGVNLHVLVAENAALDAEIVEVGIDEDAAYLPGFGAQIDMEANRGMPKLWAPVLGEGQIAQLQRIRALVTPDEVCPVVPFPSKDPRRGDALLFTHDYCRLLFDDLRIDPANVLYADERNPFQVYRQIREVVLRHTRAFQSLGGCGAVLSALSSKLLSLGVLLAGVDLKRSRQIVGIAHVDTKGYRMVCPKADNLCPDHDLVHLWLCGECYEC